MKRSTLFTAMILAAAPLQADPPDAGPSASAPSAPSPAAPAPAALPPSAPAPGAPAAATPATMQAPPRPRAPEFALEGTAGQTRRLRDYLGRVVILMYEDRDSNQQNDALKRELAQRARSQDLTHDVAVVPVANLSGYHFWPAEGFARDAVVDIARQQQIEILIDWTGSMASAYRFRAGVSYVMVLDRAGRVLFRHAGPLAAQQRVRFFDAVADGMMAAAASEG